MLLFGLSGTVVAGTALFALNSTIRLQRSGQASIVRPVETIRVDTAIRDETTRTDTIGSSYEPINVPPPLGTIKRMEGISKAFSKQ
jgi:hypothetical protein